MPNTEQFMLDQLERADGIIERCLADPNTRWFSMLVDDVFPNIERMWVRMDDGFLAVVHRILPVPKNEQPLLHWHRRPIEFLLKDGAYWEGRAVGAPGGPPPPVTSEHLCSPGEQRVMIHPNEWHWVRPRKYSVISINVFGRAHPNVPERKTLRELSVLPPDRLARLIIDTQFLYGITA